MHDVTVIMLMSFLLRCVEVDGMSCHVSCVMRHMYHLSIYHTSCHVSYLDPNARADMMKAELESKINKPTFESIAKEREHKKKEAEQAMRKKMMGHV